MRDMREKCIEQEAGPHQKVPNDQIWEKTFRKKPIYIYHQSHLLREPGNSSWWYVMAVGCHRVSNPSQVHRTVWHATLRKHQGVGLRDGWMWMDRPKKTAKKQSRHTGLTGLVRMRSIGFTYGIWCKYLDLVELQITLICLLRMVVATRRFLECSPRNLGKMIPNLTSIFFKWVETRNHQLVYVWYIYLDLVEFLCGILSINSPRDPLTWHENGWLLNLNNMRFGGFGHPNYHLRIWLDA